MPIELWAVIACGIGSGAVRSFHHQQHPFRQSRQRKDAEHRGRHSGRGAAPISIANTRDRHRRRRRGDHSGLYAGRSGRHRLRHRRHSLGRGRLYRHERLGPRQCAHRRGRPRGPGPGPDAGVPLRRGHRHAGRGPRAFWASPATTPSCCPWAIERPAARRSAGGARLRRVADFDLRAVSAAVSSPRAPTSAPIWSARSKRASPRTIRATRR